MNEIIGKIEAFGKTFEAIILPKVVEEARKYFNCNSINGMLLENNNL